MVLSNWLRGIASRPALQRRSRQRRKINWAARSESLEDKVLLSNDGILWVNTGLDVSDPNDAYLTLREALVQAGHEPGIHTIQLGLDHQSTIELENPLIVEDIEQGVDIAPVQEGVSISITVGPWNPALDQDPNQHGEIVTYSGRDLSFESKWDKWIKQGRPDGQKPNKHRFVKGYHRGLELYGGHVGQLQEDYVRKSLGEYGLVVVEGMNDVLRLEELGICAVGLCSNRATGTQVSQVANNAQQLADNEVLLLPDPDDEGIAGFKDLAWELLTTGIKTRCVLTGIQPEELPEQPI